MQKNVPSLRSVLLSLHACSYSVRFDPLHAFKQLHHLIAQPSFIVLTRLTPKKLDLLRFDLGGFAALSIVSILPGNVSVVPMAGSDGVCRR